MSYYVLYALSVTPTVPDPPGQLFSYIVKSFYLTGDAAITSNYSYYIIFMHNASVCPAGRL